jgi:hypothetical protein
MQTVRLAGVVLGIIVALVVGACGGSTSGTVEPPAQDPGESGLPYVIVFVATRGHADPVTQTPPHFGVDVISASNPAPHGPKGGLYARLPDRRVRKLFPLPVHEQVPGLIDTPLGGLERGAVVEPNVSEDGRTVYFAWFHDQTWKRNGGGWQQLELSYKGADLYRLDLGPLIDEPDTDPASLPVQRLTFKRYDGPPKQNVLQKAADRFRDARNPSMGLASHASEWGQIDMHLVEMRTHAGLKALWVSNRGRTGNSNTQVGAANHNFGLYVADFRSDGSLGPAEPFQYYTTTSALSPIPLENGIAFSYQSSTDEARRWDIQWIDSEGRWKPLLGYGHGTELFHLGAYVVDAEGTGWFIGTKYYQVNDGGFGQLHRLRLDAAGLNRFEPEPWGVEPRQLSRLLTVGASAHDEPSERVPVDGVPTYIGKFTTPRPGRKGGEYLMAWTPTSANRWLPDADGRTGVWQSQIVYRPNLLPFEPHEQVDPETGKGLVRVLADPTGEYDLLWPTPMLSWRERTGKPRQGVADPIVPTDTTIEAGLPFAEVGTSAIYNTDIRPYDCYLPGGRPFSPGGLSSNETERLVRNVEGLRRVVDPADPCRYLEDEDVLGIAIQLTSNRVDLPSLYQPTYETSGGDSFREAVTLLGVYAAREENDHDQSFQARIPADVPFEFHLLDRQTGMKLVDVRSWHSLKPRERRVDCGGCHQHEAGFAIPFEGTEAATKPALDMTASTKHVVYDAACRPVLASSDTPALPVPEWRADVWPGFDQHCSRCHDATRSADTAALSALDYVDEESAWEALSTRGYASSVLGALGSPAFWAAYGARTDGRDNTLSQYQPDYPSGRWGYRFSPVHASDPGLCAAANPAWADWVRVLGQWIDHHMPRDTGDPAIGYRLDRFHPTIDLARVGHRLRIGFWDDGGIVDVRVMRNGATFELRRGLPNGSFELDLPPDDAPGDVYEATALDPTGNRKTALLH